jgi:hypothetical protein
MAIGFSTEVRNAQMDAFVTTAGNGALLRLYTGSRPATGDALTGQTLLGTLVLGSPLAPGASGGVITFNPITPDANADNSGVASWARLVKSDGSSFVADFTVTVTGGGGDITMNSTTISAGQLIEAVSATLAAGNP